VQVFVRRERNWRPGGSNKLIQRRIMTTPKTTPIISTECQNDAKAHMYGFNGMPKCKGPRVVSTEWQNDAKAKTFATFALPPALNW